jgi:hypothetical protein
VTSRSTFSFTVKILVAGPKPMALAERERRTVSMSKRPEEWDAPDVHAFMNLMCALVRPRGALFLYTLSPTAADQWSITVLVGGADFEIVASEPMALRLAVVDEMDQTNRRALLLEHRPYREKEGRGGTGEYTP